MVRLTHETVKKALKATLAHLGYIDLSSIDLTMSDPDDQNDTLDSVIYKLTECLNAQLKDVDIPL